MWRQRVEAKSKQILLKVNRRETYEQLTAMEEMNKEEFRSKP